MKISQVYMAICQENRRNKVSKHRLGIEIEGKKVNQLDLGHPFRGTKTEPKYAE